MALLMPSAVMSCLTASAQQSMGWGAAGYYGAPWVRNVSRPNEIKHGLDGRHLSVWASHGRYFSPQSNIWKWQRVNLFGTNEDLFTQTFVVPYLIPMLERAGAVVFTPRERDWQVHETVVDNDNTAMMVDGKVRQNAEGAYFELGDWSTWTNAGFLMPDTLLKEGDLPFLPGTCRMAETTSAKYSTASVVYYPSLAEDGEYAVYVSYPVTARSVTDAHYIVKHRGKDTHFRVNQQMGGGTWVYLGSFDFAKGDSLDNCIIVDNVSRFNGVVGTDAVRLGGGMGTVQRNGKLSGLPRCLEGARYSAEWSGAPYNIYSSRSGTDDYSDDINVRSLMTNWLAGGSVYAPANEGLGVPLELSLAVHSDAGFNKDMKSVFGSLAICTTDYDDTRLGSGTSRFNSHDFAQALLTQIDSDLKVKYGRWNIRELYDKNYSETRLPIIPSAIIETLSHQSFPDMLLAHDPNFKFTLSRAIYKVILHQVAASHGEKCVVAPLQPRCFRISLDNRGKATLAWKEQTDSLEQSAKANGYILYTAMDGGGYDNGQLVKGTSTFSMLNPNHLYRFRVSAVNDGGESFPSEELCACYRPGSGQVMIVNNFHRLSSPAVVNDGHRVGFDIDADPGVSYGMTAGWVGRQRTFSNLSAGEEGPGTFGYSGNELAGHFVAGNDFNYVAEHAQAIMDCKRYSVVSCSAECIDEGIALRLPGYFALDVLCGNECDDGHSLVHYKTFSSKMQGVLRNYPGKLIVSGSYIGSDNSSETDSSFVADVLHFDYKHQYRDTSDSAQAVRAFGRDITVYRSINARHFASTASDVIDVIPDDTMQASAPLALTPMTFADGSPASVAYAGPERRVFCMGFPFECIVSREDRAAVMDEIFKNLLK